MIRVAPPILWVSWLGTLLCGCSTATAEPPAFPDLTRTDVSPLVQTAAFATAMEGACTGFEQVASRWECTEKACIAIVFGVLPSREAEAVCPKVDGVLRLAEGHVVVGDPPRFSHLQGFVLDLPNPGGLVGSHDGKPDVYHRLVRDLGDPTFVIAR